MITIHKLDKDDLSTFPEYNQPVLVRIKGIPDYYYVVCRKEYIDYDYNSVRDVFIEYRGEQFSYWNIDEIDSWISFDDLNAIWDIYAHILELKKQGLY